MAPARQYSIVVYGATGFTGQLVAQYLSTVPAIKGKWAVAGRSEGKVHKRMQEVGVVDIPVVVADSSDHDSLVAMCKQTKLVISLVGPYTHYGEPLVAACAENGTHYVDLTGEAPWASHMIRKYARTAVATSAILIHATGYDSVPSDLTTFLAVQRLKNLAGPDVKVGPVRAAFAQQGGASGGTIASALAILNGSAEDRAIASNPYALSPTLQISADPSPVSKAPFNSAIVRRTWGIFETADPSSKVLSYGPDFSYDEYLVAPPLLAPFISLAFFFGFAILALFSPARWALGKYGPQPGTGPSKKAQENGWFKVQTTAKSVDGKHEAQVTMRGKGDPGYLATSKMISECALSIVLDYERLPPLARTGGPLTPASALGHVLVERLEGTGAFSFTAEEGKKSA